MQGLAEAAGWLFGWLLRNSAHAAILAVVVWGLERTVGRSLPPRWRYAMWLVVVARLLLPAAPESSFSLFNLVDLAPANVAGVALQVLGLPAPLVVSHEALPDPLVDTPGWFVWALALWFPGALILAFLVWRDHRRLVHALRATSPILDAEVLDLLRQSKAVMAVRERVTVVETSGITSPAISGCWRPRLLLPNGLLSRLTPDEIRFLFLHELAHVKRADLALNWVLAAIQILHWFNPVVWLALRRLLAVREEVCDSMVLRSCFPGASREYGLTLLRLLEECAPKRLVPALAGVLDDVRTLRKRIVCIRDFGVRDPHPAVPAGLTLAVALAGLTERTENGADWVRRHQSAAAEWTIPKAPHNEPAPTAPASVPLATPVPPAPRPASEAPPPEDTPRRADLSARFLGTLSMVMQQTLADLLPDASGSTRSAGSAEPPTSPNATAAVASPGASAASAGPPQHPHPAPIPPPLAAPRLVQTPASGGAGSAPRPGTRPYPLPPVDQRGDVIRPPRPSREATSGVGGTVRSFEGIMTPGIRSPGTPTRWGRIPEDG
ncbi:MAG: hypothetical protein KF833_04900 [Verrucomicrobiae bacterium]|nr:hypothetical protein [Verrucomicrobiae bacterium]